MTLRPVGHITDSIRNLTRWRDKREALNLEVATLDTAVAFLTEYRDLINELDKQARATKVPS